MVPRDIFKLWRGNLAIDATFGALYGREGNPISALIDDDRRSINCDGGWYKRGGNHDGETAERREKLYWGLEMESAVMTANRPGEKAEFPLLTLAVGSHRPGKIKGAGKRILDSLQERDFPVDHVMGDRAYWPGAMAEELQGPFLDAGYTAVFDYGVDDFGKTTHFDHAVQVMGQWYVSCLPSDLVNAETIHAGATRLAAVKETDDTGKRKTKAAIAVEKAAAKRDQASRRASADRELADRKSMRELYRLTRKGKTRSDGSQQYNYPDPATYLAVDEITGEILEPLGKRSVVIPREVGLKYSQKYVHKSEKWQGFYSLRNTVEASYGHMKAPQDEAFGDAAKRPKRGNTFAFVAMALAVVSANIRKIRDFIRQVDPTAPMTAKNRRWYPEDDVIQTVETVGDDARELAPLLV